MKTRMSGFQKPLRADAKPVGLAIVRLEGITATCSCGWAKKHIRSKVREDATDWHLTKKHAGRGVRL